MPRLVAIGDLHGDMQKARRAFRLGGLVDASDRWAGGTTTAVQVLLYFVSSGKFYPVCNSRRALEGQRQALVLVGRHVMHAAPS